MSEPRSSYIYVQRSTRRRLHLIAGALGGITPDQVADELLNEAIEIKYPGVLQTEQQIVKLESELAAMLKKGKNGAQNHTENPDAE